MSIRPIKDRYYERSYTHVVYQVRKETERLPVWIRFGGTLDEAVQFAKKEIETTGDPSWIVEKCEVSVKVYRECGTGYLDEDSTYGPYERVPI